MKKTSTIKKAQMGAAVPAKSKPAKLGKFNPKTPSPKGSKGAVYEGYTLPEYTVKAPKAKTGTSLGMKSVKAGYDKNPGVTRADIISAATGKAKNGAKVASKKVVTKKPIKKAQDGTKMVVDGKEYESGSMLPEVTVTASRITDDAGKKKSGKGGRGRGLRDILEGNKIGRQMAKSYYGRGPLANRGPGTNRPGGNQLRQGRRRARMYEEGGEVSMAKKGASVKKSVGKCKYGC
jgi:ribosomal protein L18E